MPWAPDKVIINNLRVVGGNAAILKEYEALAALSAETIKRGLEPHTGHLRDKLIASCTPHSEADEKHLRELRAITDEWALWLDAQP